MAENSRPWIWQLLRKKSRKDLDAIERALINTPAEKREYAGDPNQGKQYWVRTLNK